MDGFVFQLAELLPVCRIEQEQAHDVDGEHGKKQPRVNRGCNGGFEIFPR